MGRFRSIRYRIALWVVGFALLLFGATFATMYVYGSDVLHETTDKQLTARITSLLRLVERDGGAISMHAAVRQLPALSARRPFRAFAVRAADPAGTTLVSRSIDERPDVAVELLGVPFPNRQYSGTLVLRSEGRVQVRCLRPDAATGIDLIVVAEDLDHVDEELGELVRGFAVALVPTMLLALAFAWLCARRIAGPIVEIAAAANRIEAGGSPASMPEAGSDELGALSRVLEQSFRRIQSAVDRERRFTTDASHELRTPLATLLADSEVALRGEPDPESYRRTIERVVVSATRIQTTLDALLMLARFDTAAQAKDAATADLGDVLAAATEGVARKAADRGVAIIGGHADGVAVLGDADLLAVALRNLLANAIEHGRERGRIEIVVRPDGTDEVIIDVCDDGPGTPADVLGRVNARSGDDDAATLPALSGRGRGLSIVRRIIGLFGGRFEIRNGPGGGTTASMLLRVRPPTAA